MKREDFVKQVVEEIEHIKKVATQEEINRLDLSEFNHDDRKNCIYGQMFYDCRSERAIEVYQKQYKVISDSFLPTSFEEQDFSEGKNHTALEKYLFVVDEEIHKHIIKYLKGEVVKLNIE